MATGQCSGEGDVAQDSFCEVQGVPRQNSINLVHLAITFVTNMDSHSISHMTRQFCYCGM